jgi:hypothetical protein
MEISTMTVLSGVSMLSPIAMYVGRSCLTRIRNPLRIQKHCLLIPPKSGKSYLKNMLSKQKKIMVIDLDEFLHASNENKNSDLKRIEEALKNKSWMEYELYYKNAADNVFKFIKEQIKSNSKLKVLFITSSYAFSSAFRPDAVVATAPDVEFFEKLIEGLTPEEQMVAKERRTNFLEALPDKNACSLYHSLDELEKAVRSRFSLSYNME